MNRLKKALKQRVKALLMLFPWGIDIYRRYFEYRRYLPSFRNVYSNIEAALASIGEPEKANYEYFNSTRDLDDELAKFDKVFDDADYPVLFWLSQLMNSTSDLVELGGNTGWAYYSYQKYMTFPESLGWTVIETPSAVANGRQIAKTHGNTQLTFAEAIDPGSQADIFITSGALQYIDKPVAEILSGIRALPKHVIVNRTPMYDGPEYWTIQNLGPNELPYKILNRHELIESMRDIGYEIRDSWRKHRQIDIPFYPEHQVDYFHGIYFRKIRAE